MKKLRIIRTIKNITQWDLTEATGIPNYRISLFEKGRIARAIRTAVPTADAAAILAWAMNLPDDVITPVPESGTAN